MFPDDKTWNIVNFVRFSINLLSLLEREKWMSETVVTLKTLNNRMLLNVLLIVVTLKIKTGWRYFFLEF